MSTVPCHFCGVTGSYNAAKVADVLFVDANRASMDLFQKMVYMGDDELELPKRKPNRLKNYDYSQNGAYFITICTKDRSELLWMVGARIARPQEPAPLSEYGIGLDSLAKRA